MALGHEVVLLSVIGDDLHGAMVKKMLANSGIGSEHVLTTMSQTAQSVILYDASGRREIFTDLKDIQQRTFPIKQFEDVTASCELCVLCNINFARGLIPVAKRLGKTIACAVHTISHLEDDFNRDFMAAADILFCSNERLPEPPELWVETVSRRYGTSIQVVGLGAAGALLAVRGRQPQHVPAVTTRPVVNTIGAGDSLFSAFLHGWLCTGGEPLQALRLATIFASWKVGGNGGADCFLTGDELQRLAAAYGVLP